MKALLKDSEKLSPELIKELENYSTEKPCTVCRIETENGNAFHHLITQKNLGPDTEWNLMPLCLGHHKEAHDIGRTSFAGKYSAVKAWMLERGWEYVEFTNKWSHFANSEA